MKSLEPTILHKIIVFIVLLALYILHVNAFTMVWEEVAQAPFGMLMYCSPYIISFLFWRLCRWGNP